MDRSTSVLEAVRAAAAPYGLNLVAAIPAARYDRAVKLAARVSPTDPRAASIVVIGNGGGAFWKSFRAHCAANPGWLEREHPLDDFTRELVEGAVAPRVRHHAVRWRATYPFMQDAPGLNFMELARLAGLGGPSVLGVLVHPLYGPWIALRAALLLDVALDSPGPALGFDPCPGCTVRSCMPACPVGAVTFPGGWDISRCLAHRVEAEADCAPQCHARFSCVLGPEHRYPADELAYHQMRALGAMRPHYAKREK